MIGRIYSLGWGVDKDLLKAEKHFSMAANSGLVHAEKLLGSLLMRKGKWMEGAIMYINGIWHHFRFMVKDKHDPRLRSV